LISEDITAEISQVLTYPKLQTIYQTTEIHRADLIEQVLRIAKFVEVTKKVEVIKDHPADNKFVECALAAKADYIVSGDNHVLKTAAYKETKMLSVNDFLKLIE
jgi:putative PIN family toxin of toxin-antitoxin system